MFGGALRHRMAKKVLGVFVLFSFFLNFIVASTGAIELVSMDLYSLMYPPEEKFVDIDVDTFVLPAHLGTVRFQSRGTTDKFIIHIQDAHCNYFAQKKINEIMDYLIKEYEIKNINLEGGAGAYDLSIFTNIRNTDVRAKVADHFVVEGLVNGAEYYAINNSDKVTLWGLEDPELYMRNLMVYRDSLQYKTEVEEHLKKISHIMENLKRRIYPKELYEFDQQYVLYKTNELTFKDYLSYLVQKAKDHLIDTRAYPNIYLLYQSLEQEGEIDFKKANAQRDDLIERLRGVVSKKALEELVLKTVEYKSKRISRYDYYDFVVKKARFSDISLEEYPEFQKYFVYISLYHAADRSMVTKEMMDMEDAIKGTLYKNEKQKELNVLSKNLTLMKNLFDISLTKEDYKYYRENKSSFELHNYTSFIKREAPIYKIRSDLPPNIMELDQYRENLESFYEYSFARDDAFMKNLTFTKRGKEIAIVVTGGFHTENLCDLYGKENYSYVSIMPNFRSEKGYECPYFDLLAGEEFGMQKTLYDAILSSSMIQVASMLQATPALQDAWGKANIDAFRAAVLIQAELAQGRKVEIKLADRTLSFGKGAETVSMSLRELMDAVHQREIDAPLEEAYKAHEAKLRETGASDIVTPVNQDARNTAAERLEKLASGMSEFASRLEGQDAERKRINENATKLKNVAQAVRNGAVDINLVDLGDVGFAAHAGGKGININKRDADTAADLIVHEAIGGIVSSSHFIGVDIGMLASAEFFDKPLWEMKKEERLEVDRDFAQKENTVVTAFKNAMADQIQPAWAGRVLGPRLADHARIIADHVGNFMVAGDSKFLIAAERAYDRILNGISGARMPESIAQNTVNTLALINNLTQAAEEMGGVGKDARIQRFINEAHAKLKDTLIDILAGDSDGALAAEFAGRGQIIAALGEGLSAEDLSRLSYALNRAKRNSALGNRDVAARLTNVARKLALGEELTLEEYQLLGESGRFVSTPITESTNEAMIRSALMAKGSDLSEFFMALNEAQQKDFLERVMKNLSVVDIEAEEVFIEEGSRESEAYLILSGGIKVEYPVIGGEGMAEAFRTDETEGLLQGEIALTHRTRRNARVTATAPVKALRITPERLEAIFEDRADLRKKFDEVLSKLIESRQRSRESEERFAKAEVVGRTGADQKDAFLNLLAQGIITIEKAPEDWPTDLAGNDENLDKLAGKLAELEKSKKQSIAPILKKLMKKDKDTGESAVVLRVNSGEITDESASFVRLESGEIEFGILNQLINVNATKQDELEELQQQLNMVSVVFDRGLERAVIANDKESFRKILAQTIDGLLRLYSENGLLRYDDNISGEEGDMIKGSLEREIALYLEHVGEKPLDEKNAQNFVDLLGFSLNTYVCQKGGIMKIRSKDSRGNDVETFIAYGSGGNRLRGSNGSVHAIMNADKVDAMADAYNKALDKALAEGKISKAVYDAKYITPQLLLESRFALIMHDAMAGNVRNANAGLYVFGDIEDLKAGHGAAAVEYTRTKRVRGFLNELFGPEGTKRIRRNIAEHDYTDIDFSSREAAVMTMVEIADNTAAAEKFMDTFTRVDGNEVLLGRLQELETICTIDDELNFPLYGRMLQGIKDQMLKNIADAAEEGRITANEAEVYTYTVINDLNQMTAKMSIGAYNAGAFRSDLVSFEIDGDGTNATGYELTVVQERGYYDNEFKQLFGNKLADAHIIKITSEPYGNKKEDAVDGSQDITRGKGFTMKIAEAAPADSQHKRNAENLVKAIITGRIATREYLNNLNRIDSTVENVISALQEYFAFSDYETNTLVEAIGINNLKEKFLAIISSVPEIAEAAPEAPLIPEAESAAELSPQTFDYGTLYHTALRNMLPATSAELDAAEGIITAIYWQDIMGREIDDEALLTELERLAGAEQTPGRMDMLGLELEAIKDLGDTQSDVQAVRDDYSDVIWRVNQIARALIGTSENPGPWSERFGEIGFNAWRSPILLARVQKILEGWSSRTKQRVEQKEKARVAKVRARERTAELERQWTDRVQEYIGEIQMASPQLKEKLLRLLGLYYMVDRALDKDYIYDRLVGWDGATVEESFHKALVYMNRYNAGEFWDKNEPKLDRFQQEIDKTRAEVAQVRLAEAIAAEYAAGLIEDATSFDDWIDYRRFTRPSVTLSEEELSELPAFAQRTYREQEAADATEKAAARSGAEKSMKIIARAATGLEDAGLIDLNDQGVLHMVDVAIFNNMLESINIAVGSYRATGDIASLMSAYEAYFGENGLEKALSRITDQYNVDPLVTGSMKLTLMSFMRIEDELGRDLEKAIENAKAAHKARLSIASNSLDQVDRLMDEGIAQGRVDTDALITAYSIAETMLDENTGIEIEGAVGIVGDQTDIDAFRGRFIEISNKMDNFSSLRSKYIEEAGSIDDILASLRIDPTSELGEQLKSVDLNELKARVRILDQDLQYPIFYGRGLSMLRLSSEDLSGRASVKQALDASNNTEEAVSALEALGNKATTLLKAYREEDGLSKLKRFVNSMVSWGVDIFGHNLVLLTKTPSMLRQKKTLIERLGLTVNKGNLTASEKVLRERSFKKANNVKQALNAVNADMDVMAELDRLDFTYEQFVSLLDAVKERGYENMKGITVAGFREMAISRAGSVTQIISILNVSSDVGLTPLVWHLRQLEGRQESREVEGKNHAADRFDNILQDMARNGLNVYENGEGMEILYIDLLAVVKGLDLGAEQEASTTFRGVTLGEWMKDLSFDQSKAVDTFMDFRKSALGKKLKERALKDTGLGKEDLIGKDKSANRMKAASKLRELIIKLTQYSNQQDMNIEMSLPSSSRQEAQLDLLTQYRDIIMKGGPEMQQSLDNLKGQTPNEYGDYIEAKIVVVKEHLRSLGEAGKPYEPYLLEDIDSVSRVINRLGSEIENIQKRRVAMRAALQAELKGEKVEPLEEAEEVAERAEPAAVKDGALGDALNQVRTQQDLADLVGEEISMNDDLRSKINKAFDFVNAELRRGKFKGQDDIIDMVEMMLGSRDRVMNNLYLFNARVEGENNYLLGFNITIDGRERTGLSLEQVRSLSDRELAEFIFHEMFEIGIGHEEIYGKYDRANSIQGRIFGETNPLKGSFRNFINRKAQEFEIAKFTAAPEKAAPREGAENMESRQRDNVEAGEEIERRKDPVKIIVAGVFDLENPEAFTSIERSARKFNSEVKTKFGEEVDNQQVIVFKVDPNDPGATIANYKKAMDRAMREMDKLPAEAKARIVSFTPQMENVELADDVLDEANPEFAKYRADARVTILRDGYTDAFDRGEARAIDVAARFVLGRQIAAVFNAENEAARREGLNSVKNMLSILSGEEIVATLNTLDDLKTFLANNVIRINPLDYEEIRDYEDMQLAVAVSL